MRLLIPVDEKYDYNIDRVTRRGSLVTINLTDLHMGAIDPKVQYQIYREQIINVITKLPIVDIISIPGDLFDKKFMASSEVIVYANQIIADLRAICIEKNATLVIIAGTSEHDAGQLSLFYHLLEDPLFDIRIVETIKFEYIKGAKILCIPELYNMEEKYYSQVLFNSGWYDLVLMHGTFEGCVYGDNAGQSRLFVMSDFINCMGPIISGHVHTPGCHQEHFYYGGTPLRYKFGEEEPKGFLILLYDLDSRRYHIHFQEVKSFRYDTVSIDELLDNDPDVIIKYINDLREKENIHHIRVRFGDNIAQEKYEVLKEYFITDKSVKLDRTKSKEMQLKESEQSKEYEQYAYIFDKNLSPYDILAQFINESENSKVIDASVIENLMKEAV